MAKQRGIHQIRGKIDNLSYYEQKYVRGGLIRRINAAMSERLKTDPAFQATRNANSIFGGCSLYAAALLSSLGNRNTYLFKPNRQALLTKIIKENACSIVSGSSFMSIGFVSTNYIYSGWLLRSLFKNDFYNFFPTMPRYASDLSLGDSYEIEFPEEYLVRYCEYCGVDAVQISVSSPWSLYTCGYSQDRSKFKAPEISNAGRGSLSTWNKGDISLVVGASTGDIDDAFTYWVIYITPVSSFVGDRPIIKRSETLVYFLPFKAG